MFIGPPYFHAAKTVSRRSGKSVRTALRNPRPPPCKKSEAGADFIQTNYVFDIPRFERFMDEVRSLGLHERVFIMPGVGPLAGAKAARWMRTNVPGIHIPDDIVARLEKAKKPSEEGKKICIELIQQIREIAGVAGVHIMAYRREHMVNAIIDESGLGRERLSLLNAASAKKTNAALRGGR